MIKGEMWALNMLLTARPYKEEPFHYSDDIWIVRGGGYGDLLMLTPMIRAMKLHRPTATIHVACGRQYHDLFLGMDVITELLPLPITNAYFTSVICYEEHIEGHPAAETTHMAQHFANKAGITLTDITPDYRVHPTELTVAFNRYPPTKRPRVAVQLLASALYRSYPKMQQVVAEVSKEADVFLFGLPGQSVLKEKIPNVTNLMEDCLSFRESAAVLSTCDVCIAPDSALVHLCSALDIPCVGLYGPFAAGLRISSNRAVALEGKAPCAPCFFHAGLPTDFPAGMPCEKAGRCVALEAIPVEDVVTTALGLTTPA